MPYAAQVLERPRLPIEPPQGPLAWTRAMPNTGPLETSNSTSTPQNNQSQHATRSPIFRIEQVDRRYGTPSETPMSLKRLWAGPENGVLPMAPEYSNVGPETASRTQNPTQGTLTPEQRQHKIQKYREKKKHRKWYKHVDYDCRQRVACSRLRIQGRFAGRLDLPPSQPTVGVERDIRTAVGSGSGCENSEGKYKLSMTNNLPMVKHPIFRFTRTVSGGS
jgi:hypothetical protein